MQVRWKAHFVEHDVRDETAWEPAVAATISHFGTLTAVVNSAGIGFPLRYRTCRSK
nr:SDR family oxidoreductase [Paraburkholderia oxyphila]